VLKWLSGEPVDKELSAEISKEESERLRADPAAFEESGAPTIRIADRRRLSDRPAANRSVRRRRLVRGPAGALRDVPALTYAARSASRGGTATADQ
jgi:hypothetical protein